MIKESCSWQLAVAEIRGLDAENFALVVYPRPIGS